MLSRLKLVIITVVILVLIGTASIGYIKSRKTIPEPTERAQEGFVPKVMVIGKSVEGREIVAYEFVRGDSREKLILFVGGIHGGYEWNSVLLAYEIIDYIKENPEIMPENVVVSIIPSANPDGVFKVLGKEGRFTLADVTTSDIRAHAEKTPGLGRFNANNVDLNRNFDCKWKSTGTWRSKTINAGSAPFSEPESKAIRDFVLSYSPDVVVFWHSQANAVYASECEAGILPETMAVMNAYSVASGYSAIPSFDAYPVSGDAEGWLASINIPAITVELQSHEKVEFEKNLAGVMALIKHYRMTE